MSTVSLVSKFVRKPVATYLRPATISRCLSSKPESKPKEAKVAVESDSFVMNLFKGKLKVDQMFPFPQVLSEDQVETMGMMLPALEAFYKGDDPAKHDEAQMFDEKTRSQLQEIGFYGATIPEEYGGMSLINTMYARLAATLGHHDLSLCIHIGAHLSIGLKGIILFGTPEQKQKYLPTLATGEKIAAFCLTEPSSGSDAASIQCKAELTPDGKHYVLNGSKIWISNGGIAEVFTVFAQTPMETSKGIVNKISAFIVERSMGVKSGPPEKKMGIKASNTTELYFEDVLVPVENLLGPKGEGFKVAMNILNNGRFGMASALSGTCKYAIQRAAEHASNRVQFGSSLASFGLIQEKIAEMTKKQYITESLAFMVSGIMDRGFTEFQLEAAVSKVYSSEAVWYCLDESLQILGGMGFMKEAGIEKFVRDARIFRIFEGANDVLRLYIALTGLQYGGSHLKELQKALQHPVSNLGMILDEGKRRVQRAVGISTTSSLHGCVHPSLTQAASQVPKLITNFNSAVEHLLIRYGKNIIHEQFFLARLADATINLYAMVTCLSRCTDSLEKKLATADYEITLVNLICQDLSQQITNSLNFITDSSKPAEFVKLQEVAKKVFEENGIPTIPPSDRPY